MNAQDSSGSQQDINILVENEGSGSSKVSNVTSVDSAAISASLALSDLQTSAKNPPPSSLSRNSDAWSAVSRDSDLNDVVGDKGELSDEYIVGNQIGLGGNSIVYEGWRVIDYAHIVIKVMSISSNVPPDMLKVAVKRFYREASLISTLGEKHIRQCLDYGLFKGVPCMILEYVDGFDLNKLIERDGPLPLKEATNIIEQILGALDEPHRRGIIHRDIKPSNIMVLDTAPPYQVRILDFGIASVLSIFRESGDITQQGMTRGTPSYMAPEMFTEAGKPSIESDLYSVGLVYMEMLTGKPVFSYNSYTEVAFKHMRSPLEIPSYIPQSIANIILRLCDKLPENRYHSAFEVIERIDACIESAIAEEKQCARQFEKMPSYHNSYSNQHQKVERDSIPPKKHGIQISLPLIGVGVLMIAALAFVVIGFIQQQKPTNAPTTQTEPVTAIPATPPDPSSEAPQSTEEMRKMLHQVYIRNGIQLASTKVNGIWQLSIALTDDEGE